jgi:DNA-binding transcriptional LysR family regulator
MANHPKVSLRANISDSNIDFYRDAVDLALRYGSPTEANLYGFKICNIPRLLCASPDYLASHGTPTHPQDLASHNALLYQLHDIIHDVWVFEGSGEQHKIKMQGNRASNDSDLVRRWCVAGKGLAAKSCLDMADDLLAGRVKSVMPQARPKPTELWLVFPSRQSITPAARLLRDTLKEKTNAVLKQLVDKEILEASMLD